jgi:hypothetical protein
MDYEIVARPVHWYRKGAKGVSNISCSPPMQRLHAVLVKTSLFEFAWSCSRMKAQTAQHRCGKKFNEWGHKVVSAQPYGHSKIRVAQSVKYIVGFHGGTLIWLLWGPI